MIISLIRTSNSYSSSVRRENTRIRSHAYVVRARWQKVSKRAGAVSVLEFRNEGILPKALLNYLVRLGWSHGDDEIMSIEQNVLMV